MDTTTIPQGNVYWDEICYAVDHTSRHHLREWASSIPGLATRAGWRRATGFTQLATGIVRATRDGIGNIADAYVHDRLVDHCKQTALDVYHAYDEKITALNELLAAIKEQPMVIVPKLIFAGLGFYAGSGGLDGNGGIPDLDLLFGIDAHRSFLTHSIIAGIALETVCLASLGLFTAIYYNLPDNHQPLWDTLHKQLEENGALFLFGGSAGIAYHLGVDALLQPNAYHDLPIHMPIESHQTLMAVNAAAETGAAAQLKHLGKLTEHFATFAEATTTARKNPGSKIRRAPDGDGFWVFHPARV